MRLGAVFANILADLEFAEFLDDVGPDEHGDEHAVSDAKTVRKVR